jgi:hypothetical protein
MIISYIHSTSFNNNNNNNNNKTLIKSCFSTFIILLTLQNKICMVRYLDPVLYHIFVFKSCVKAENHFVEFVKDKSWNWVFDASFVYSSKLTLDTEYNLSYLFSLWYFRFFSSCFFFCIRSSTFVLLHLFFYVRSSTFVLLHSFFYIRSSTFVLLHSFFYIRSSTFVLLHSFFYIHSSTFILPRSFSNFEPTDE